MTPFASVAMLEKFALLKIARCRAPISTPSASSHPNSKRLDAGRRVAWKVDREDAPFSRQVAGIDPAVVRFDGPPAEGEPEPHPGAIGAALLERVEQVVGVSPRKPAAFILDLEEHAIVAGADPERDGGRRPRELEGVLEQGRDHC